jgi:hypothetical protein
LRERARSVGEEWDHYRESATEIAVLVQTHRKR